MAGLFDLHLMTVLNKGWDALAADKATFFSLYEGVSDEIKQQWYDYLVPDGANHRVRFQPAYVPEQTKLPAVIVLYADEPEDVSPLDYFGGTYSGAGSTKIERKNSILLQQIALVHIMAEHPEILRALHLAMLAVCLNTRATLYNLGYIDLEYLGGGDVEVERMITEDEAGVYTRIQRWRARSHLEMSNTYTPAGKAFVHATDATIDTFAGGIDLK